MILSEERKRVLEKIADVLSIQEDYPIDLVVVGSNGDSLYSVVNYLYSAYDIGYNIVLKELLLSYLGGGEVKGEHKRMLESLLCDKACENLLKKILYTILSDGEAKHYLLSAYFRVLKEKRKLKGGVR